MSKCVITASDRKRFENFNVIGCICCKAEGLYRVPVEAHHLLSGNRRRGHQFSLPLCRWHHRGETMLTKDQATQTWGPSLADGSKPFHERYGSDDELLAKTNELLKAVA